MKTAKLGYLKNLPEVSSQITRWADKEAALLSQIETLELALAAVRTQGHDAARTQWSKDEIATAKANAT